MSIKRKIAVVMELGWPYKRHYETFAGIREYADEHGGWEFEMGDFPKYEMQKGKKFDGIVGRISEETLVAGKNAKIPVVNVMFDSPVCSKTPCVLIDIRSAGKLAAEHLIDRGFMRLVSFGFKGSAASKAHFEGMMEVAEAQNIPCKHYMVPSNYSDQERIWKQFFDYTNEAIASWQAPIGVALSSDELAFAVTTICKARGWVIPEKMAIIGMNNEVMICNSSNPTISSIDMSDRRCGYQAAHLLDRMMKGEMIERTFIQFVPPKELVLRCSTDAYAVDDQALARALAFMAKNSHQRISVSDIAMAAGIGRQTLEHRFRKQLKRTVNDELINLRVSRMKRLLVESEQTIGAISDQVGFGTTANMHVMFKRLTDMTPIAYREKYNPKLDRATNKS